MNNNKGYILLEIIISISIAMLVLSSASVLLYSSVKSWCYAQSSIEVSYNAKEALNKVTKEFNDCYGIEIIDESGNGWVKVFTSMDRSRFITFRMKNNKLYVGYNNMLNPNSEIASNIKSFKVEYLPKGSDSYSAKGVTVYFLFNNGKKNFDCNTSVAFRNL